MQKLLDTPIFMTRTKLLVIDSDLIRSLDVIEKYKRLTKGGISSCNQLVELWLSEYVKRSFICVIKKHGIN